MTALTGVAGVTVAIAVGVGIGVGEGKGVGEGNGVGDGKGVGEGDGKPPTGGLTDGVGVGEGLLTTTRRGEIWQPARKAVTSNAAPQPGMRRISFLS